MNDEQIRAQYFKDLHLLTQSGLPPNSLHYIMTRVQYLKTYSQSSLTSLPHSSLFTLIRPSILHYDSEIRTVSLRLYRYLCVAPELFQLLLSTHIEHFLVRSLELEGKVQERLESFKLLKNWLELSPNNFPKCLTSSLVAISDSENDDLKKLAIEALRILSINNPVIVVWSGGLRTLVNCLLDIHSPSALNENIVYTLCYLLNEPENRAALKNGAEILRIFAVFTESSSGLSEKDLEGQINLARKALVLMARSWSGLIFLASNGLDAVISTLIHPGKSLIKEGILETLIEILSVSIDTYSRHYDLMTNYLAILIQALLHCGLFKALISLSVDSAVRIAQRSRKLLKIITILGPELLPNCPICPVSLGLSTEGKVAELVADMDSSCRIKVEKSEENLLNATINFISTENPGIINPPETLLYGIYKTHICNSIDDAQFFLLLNKTQVIHKEPSKWEWEYIYELLSGPFSVGERLQDSRSQKFLKHLLSFFTPSKGIFLKLPWEPAHFIKAKIGSMLLNFLIPTKSKNLIVTTFSESFFVIRKSFLEEFVDVVSVELGEEVKNLNSRVLTPESLRNTMAREYFKWLGIFMNLNSGRKLLQSFHLNSKLEKIAEIDHLALILLTVLDYRERTCQHFLNFCLQAKSKFIKIKALQQVQVIYRAGQQDLNWVIDELPSILYIQDADIINTALNVINDICQNKDNLIKLITNRPPNLLKFQDKSIYLKMLTVDIGFDYLNEMHLITPEISEWDEKNNTEYGRIVEAKIVQSLNTQKKQFSLILNTPSAFQSYGKLQLSWISYLPLFIVVQVGELQLECETCLEVNKEDIFLGCYFSNQVADIGKSLAVCLKLGNSFIDFTGKLVLSPYWITCQLDSKESSKSFFYENEGVFFNFDSDGERVKLSSVKFRLLVLPKGSAAAQPPRHFFGELAKTKKGFQKIKEMNLIEKYSVRLSQNYLVVDKRGWLWALGHIGASNAGAQYLSKIGCLASIVSIAETSEILSLRGTAFQVLSLIARSPIGKHELQSLKWFTKAGSSSFQVAVPESCSTFFSIPKHSIPTYNTLCCNLEQTLNSVQLNELESQIYFHACRLGTVADKSDSENFLRNLRITQPISYQSLPLFHILMVTISGFTFKLQTRRVIHKLLERVYRVDNFEKLDQFAYVL